MTDSQTTSSSSSIKLQNKLDDKIVYNNNDAEDYDDKYKLSLIGAKEYLSTKLISSVIAGSALGLSYGYYAGEATALYGYTYGFGFGFTSCAFYSGTYVLRSIRKKDDNYNYAISGGINSAWIVGGFQRSLKKGLFAGVVGSLGGVLFKISGDWLYDTSKLAWISHRQFGMLHSQKRVITNIKKPRFPPKNERQEYSIIPKDYKDDSIKK
jgi:hypothetical protein